MSWIYAKSSCVEGGMSVERLTERPLEGEEAYLSCSKCGKADISECWDQLDCTQTAVDRLAAIENILGDDYDLDRLRELVELAKNIPHVCRFCVGCEMEPKDGHGCDEYDSFVFSTNWGQSIPHNNVQRFSADA